MARAEAAEVPRPITMNISKSLVDRPLTINLSRLLVNRPITMNLSKLLVKEDFMGTSMVSREASEAGLEGWMARAEAAEVSTLTRNSLWNDSILQWFYGNLLCSSNVQRAAEVPLEPQNLNPKRSTLNLKPGEVGG